MQFCLKHYQFTLDSENVFSHYLYIRQYFKNQAKTFHPSIIQSCSKVVYFL